jgi:hypothetical protein
MNIQEAKEQIKRSVSIYLMKDAYGNYRIPSEKQRPVFMVGAPGIGKTAIVSQIADEMGLLCVSYAMTHHTRQSAIGLPFIRHQIYQGQEFDVSVYTLSEIIASVYEAMEKSGKREGILFLDEINCVSETLAPSMLQFLQYKTFGNHKLPEGWIIVTAGNPQEFNRSARTFDIATLDRLKVLEVQPDYNAWKAYADQYHIHRAVLSFLDVRNEYFFHVETTVDGKSYVTPRGWEDLSQAMTLYEEKGYPVDETLIAQYLHNDRITADFASYYALYAKYREDYHIQEILDDHTPAGIGERMRKAQWDERMSVTEMLVEAVSAKIRQEQETENGLRTLRDPLRDLKEQKDLSKAIQAYGDSLAEEAKEREAGGAWSIVEKKNLQYRRKFVRQIEGAESYGDVQKAYGREVKHMQEASEKIQKELHALFGFLKENAGQEELLLTVTRLTVDNDTARFIAVHGCDDYYAYNDSLKTQKRNEELMQELEAFRKENQGSLDL